MSTAATIFISITRMRERSLRRGLFLHLIRVHHILCLFKCDKLEFQKHLQFYSKTVCKNIPGSSDGDSHPRASGWGREHCRQAAHWKLFAQAIDNQSFHVAGISDRASVLELPELVDQHRIFRLSVRIPADCFCFQTFYPEIMRNGHFPDFGGTFRLVRAQRLSRKMGGYIPHIM